MNRCPGRRASRQSCAAAWPWPPLCATLTESGEYRAVQVLVRAESNVGSSMRLRESYFLADSELPCDALTREETYLPHARGLGPAGAVCLADPRLGKPEPVDRRAWGFRRRYCPGQPGQGRKRFWLRRRARAAYRPTAKAPWCAWI